MAAGKPVFTLPTDLRLRRKRDFERVYAEGRQLYSKGFLVITHRSDEPEPRLGVTVTRKIDKRAVVRNRIKRRIKEIFRLNRHRLKEPLDIVVIARQNSAACSLREMERQILGALRHGGCLN